MCMILLCHSCSGFTGFELTYSNPKENISVNLSAQSGSILLSPVAMQFGQVMWSKLTIYSGNETTTSLIIEGSVEVINFALQSIQYLGYFSFIYIYIFVMFKFIEAMLLFGKFCSFQWYRKKVSMYICLMELYCTLMMTLGNMFNVYRVMTILSQIIYHLLIDPKYYQQPSKSFLNRWYQLGSYINQTISLTNQILGNSNSIYLFPSLSYL